MIRALVDTGAIFALIAKTDPHHGEAVDFLKRWVKRRGVFLITDLVFVESMTLIKSRMGPAVAIRAGSGIRANPLLAWISLTPELEQETWSVFRKYEDKEWSYTDCELLVLSGNLNIPNIFSFDSHFNQMPGIRRLP